jgi:hypothetical protein
MRTFLFLVTCLFATPLAQNADARPLTPAEQRYSPYSGSIPLCDNRRVLSVINDKFRLRESKYWFSGLVILGFGEIEEIGLRTNGIDYIPRRYCRARVVMNDNRLREISYSIAEGLGPIGIGFGTEWCIAGLDRNYAFGLDCRSARP